MCIRDSLETVFLLFWEHQDKLVQAVRRLSIEQSAAVEFGQRVGQRQTDTASLLVFCLFEAVERIEYIFDFTVGYQMPVVGDEQGEHALFT